MTTKVKLCILSCDSVARPILQNIKQFNGRYGCAFCLCEGQTVAKGRGFVRVYNEMCTERTNDNMLEHAEKCCYGVKGPTVLSTIPVFDVAKGFVPDYMHSVLLGVVRQFVYMWLDSKNHEKPFYLGKRVRDIDVLLLNLRPPSEIKRVPRSLEQRKYWKASEWRNFLLFYYVYLKNFLPRLYFDHWCLLVYSIHSLMSRNLKTDVIAACDLALHKFVYLVEELYGLANLSYNVHLLTHLASSAQQWGPLWAYSAFQFEDANGKLLGFFHGTRGVLSQIFKSYIGADYLKTLANRYVKDSNVSEVFCNFINVTTLCKSVDNLAVDVIGLGHTVCRQMTAAEVAAVLNYFGPCHILNRTVETYQRLLIKNMLISTIGYSQPFRHCDSYVSTGDVHMAYKLQSSFKVAICTGMDCVDHVCEEHLVVCVNCINLTPLQFVDSIGYNIMNFVSAANVDDQHLIVINANDISHKMFFLTVDNWGDACILLPQFELD
jgi:hypothetical protein